MTDLSPGQFKAWYRDPLHGDFRRKGDPGLLTAKGAPRPDLTGDYCGRPRGGGALDLGALQVSAGDCALPWPLSRPAR
jgi:hypothetical protein